MMKLKDKKKKKEEQDMSVFTVFQSEAISNAVARLNPDKQNEAFKKLKELDKLQINEKKKFLRASRVLKQIIDREA